MKATRIALLLVVGTIAAHTSLGQAPVITSFQGNGVLSWTNSVTNGANQVEWASSLTGTWSRSWQTVTYLEFHSVTTMSAQVPMFYRVVLMTNDPPAGVVLIDGGEFDMGNFYPGEADSDEIPVHTVSVSPFYMDRYEVSKAKWDRIYRWAITNGYSFEHSGVGTASNHPVNTVSWYDAAKWCNARSEQERLAPVYYTSGAKTTLYRTGTNALNSDCVQWNAGGYRLPTEAEWEKAARGGLRHHHYPWPSYGAGYTNHITMDQANCGFFIPPATFVMGCTPFGFGTTPVGYYNASQEITNTLGQVGVFQDMANGYGLYDMAGNVWEWCWDWYDYNWYSQPGASLKDTCGPASSPDGSRVLRGGSFDNVQGNQRCSYRDGNGGDDLNGSPGDAGTSVGFRCVRGL